MIVLVVVLVLVVTVWLYLRQVYSSFSKYGVKHIAPVPFVGNLGRILLQKHHLVDASVELRDTFPEEKFVGRYEYLKEMIFIHDIELIKKVTVKDFEHFIDHRSFFENKESYFSRNLVSLKGQDWKNMRSTLSLAFTSSKIRLMLPFILEVGDQMVVELKRKIQNSQTGYLDVECKDLTTRFSNDVIASCAFGLKVNSHADEHNEFYNVTKAASTFGFIKSTFFTLSTNFPILAQIFKLDFIDQSSKDFFRSLVLDTMKDREAHNILRPDIIHLLMESKKGRLTHEDVKSDDSAAGFATVRESAVGTKANDRVWSDTDLVSQAVLFFVAGFETVSSATSFLLYELAVNPEAQERLAQEIREENENNDGKFDFDSIQRMTYMDMFVSEVLRLWPPLVVLDRVCVKDYNLGKPNDKAEKDFIIRKGSPISIPAYAIHRDPKYFPNPDKFDPERFSEENKHNFPSFAYMPFGVGPRNCIASRFALCELKAMTYKLVQHFVLSACERTCIPPELCNDAFNMKLKGGHWVRFTIRN